MNRFLVLSSGAALVIAIMTAALWIFGYTVGNIVEVFFALPLGTIVGTLLLIFLFVPVSSISCWVLRLSIRTFGRNNPGLVTFTRKFHQAVNYPSDAFFVMLIICASTMTLRFLDIVDPSALSSPGILADIVVSSIFWGVLVAMDKFAA